jgi:hypothetical protein
VGLQRLVSERLFIHTYCFINLFKTILFFCFLDLMKTNVLFHTVTQAFMLLCLWQK